MPHTSGTPDRIVHDDNGSAQSTGSESLTSEHDEDSPHASGDKGILALAVRADAAGSLVDTDGDYAPLLVDSQGRLKTDAAGGGGGGGGTEFAEDTAHTSGALGTLALGVRNDAGVAKTSADGDYSALATDDAGRIGVSTLGDDLPISATALPLPTGAATAANQQTDALTDAELRAADVDVNVTNASIPVTLSEPISVDDNGGSLTVDGTVAVSNFPATQPVSGTVTIQDGGNVITVDGTVSVTEPVSVDDNGGSLTVDGTVAVSNFPATQPVSGTVEVTNDVGNPLPVSGTVTVNEPVSVDDNGGSLTVDASNLDIRDLTFAADKVDASGTVLGAGTNNIGDVDIESFEPSASTTLQNAATATGNGSAMQVSGYATVALEISGTFSATVYFEGSRDGGTTYYTLYGQSGIQVIDRASSPELFFINVTGLTHFRARIGDYTSGSLTARAIASPQAYTATASDVLLLPSGNAIGTVGVTSLPAGTVAGASSLPAGTNVIGGTYTVNGEVIAEDGNVYEVKVAEVQVSNPATVTIVTGVANKKIRVLNMRCLVFTVIANGFGLFVEGAGSTDITLSPRWMLATTTTFMAEINPGPSGWLCQTADGNDLKVKHSATTGNARYHINYIEYDG